MKGLFYNPANKKLNNTFSGWGGKGGKAGGYKGQKKGNGGEQYGERIMNIEKLSRNELGLTFQGFYDPSLKDLIKSLGFSQYDADRKVWIIPEQEKTQMIDRVGPYCLDNNILMGETPKFVEKIINTQIPFQKVSKVAKDLKFDYENEKKSNQKSTEDLPPKIKDSVYSFQREGIQYGINKFGRILLGDEMGVGKTVQAIGISYIFCL